MKINDILKYNNIQSYLEKFPKQRFNRYDFERNFRKKEFYNKNGPLITSAKPTIKNKSVSTKIALVLINQNNNARNSNK